MGFTLDAACYCSIGKVRKNNEDNFFFDGRCLEEVNKGLRHPVSMRNPLRREVFLAVFDGMGGENFGESASYAAANGAQTRLRRLLDYCIPERYFLQELSQKLNEAVVARARELCTERMGTTMTSLFFSGGYVYLCHLGDSRAYRLRDGEFLQLSVDHVLRRDDRPERKAPLTQYLGIDPQECLIEPYIAKGELQQGDQYLLCTDGLTDMLSNLEIDAIMTDTPDTAVCAQRLVNAALERGGKDNVTVIVCRIY